MGLILTLMMIVIPTIEIWVLVELSELVTFFAVILQCLITMVAGFWLMKGEDFSIWTLVESELLNKRVPTEEILADLLIWSGGVLMMVPGLLTDAIGIMLIIPVIRQESVAWLREAMRKNLGLPTLN